MNGTIDMNTIADAATNYPALSQLLAGYFHQDWQEDHESPEAAVQAFARDASGATVAAAASEIDRLLSAGYDDTAMSQLLADGFDCNYMPETDGLTSLAWLGEVRDTLRSTSA
jgi:hypothetical protein